MIVRRGGAHEDWSAIHALVADAFAFMDGRVDPPSSIRQWNGETCRIEAGAGAVFLAEIDGRMIGCAFAKPKGDALYLGKIAVASDQRGRGAAQAMIDSAAILAAALGLGVLELQTRVELTETHAAFAALGFRRTGETAHPGYDRPTSVTMRRAVGAGLAQT